MVCARLHIICGNCGEDKNLVYKKKQIECNNCSTIHFLDAEFERRAEAAQQMAEKEG